MSSSYSVRRGDTLWQIAQQRRIDLQKLIQANEQLQNPDLILPGQKLRIPGDRDEFVDSGSPSASGGAAAGSSGGGAASAEAAGAGGAAAASGAGKISGDAKAQMEQLASIAEAGASGKSPQGWCLKAVQDYLDQANYGEAGGGSVPRFPYARNFAEYMNAGNKAEEMGLERLDIDNPYEAPRGAIIVVAPGTPGTSHPTAGDIVVAGGNGQFFNDGEMGYGGPQNFPPGNDHVLGVYVPA